VLAGAVLEQAAGAAEGGQREPLLRLLRSLDLRCPDALDAAVNASLPPKQQAKRQQQEEGGASAGAGATDAEQQNEEERRRQVLDLLTAALDGTARCPLLEAGMTVLLAAEAPAAGVRLLVSAAATS
jgi:hypothetical protein